MIRPSDCLQQIISGVQTNPDPDIAGTGILIAFILSASLTLFTVLLAYFAGFVDDGLLRPVDKIVLKIPSRASKHPSIHIALRKAILTLSDQQIFTGIAILGAGFSGLRNGTASVYHFQVVIYLAWMSSSVHLSALTILRPWLYHHRGVLAWRIVGMLALLSMLLVALVPTVSNDWAVVAVVSKGPEPPLSAFGVPAICFWGTTYGDGVNPDSVLSFLVLFISYFWKMGGIFMPVRRTFANFLRNPVDCGLEAMLGRIARSYEDRGGRWRLYAFRIGLTVYLPIVAVLESLGSFSAALWLSILGLIYGIMQILIPRRLMRDIDPQLAQQESKLGFGQLMPLILLVQPLGAVTEHMWLKQPDDEPLYQDPYGYHLDTHQEGGEMSVESGVSLIQYMATYKTPPRTHQAPQRLQLKAFLYKSKLFHSLVWLIQAAVAATAGVVFYADTGTIGFTTTGSWAYIAFAAIAWTIMAPLIVLIVAPSSRLGRCYNHDRRTSVTSQSRSLDGADAVRLMPIDHCHDDSHSNSVGRRRSVQNASQ